MSVQYVFIAGLPRTGSKLMVNILKNAPDKSCCITPENFFLGRLFRPGIRQKMRKIGDMSLDTNVHKLVDKMYSGEYSVFSGDYWSCLADGSLALDKTVVLQNILRSNRSDKDIFTTMLHLDPGPTEVILGDKTGPNIYWVPTLLEWFPEAKIIHTFRDPRAILASEHKRRLRRLRRQAEKAAAAGQKLRSLRLKLSEPVWSLIIVLYITLAWLYAVRLHHHYKKRYPENYYLSKFEDLVEEPEENIKQVCRFLNVEFQSTMLMPPQVSSSFSPNGGTGINKQTLDSWRAYLKPWMNKWLLIFGKKYLEEFGYIH